MLVFGHYSQNPRYPLFWHYKMPSLQGQCC